jgi:hypothetical protein
MSFPISTAKLVSTASENDKRIEGMWITLSLVMVAEYAVLTELFALLGATSALGTTI